MTFGFPWLLLVILLCLQFLGGTALPPQGLPACVQETRTIQANATLQEHLKLALLKGVDGEVNNCNYTSNFDFECNIKYVGQNESLLAYNDMCQSLNGQMIHRSLDITHNFLGMWSFNVTMEEIPQCVGLSCDPSTIERVSAGSANSLVNPVFDEFIEAMEVGDICEEKADWWSELEFWSHFGVQIASLGGIDLTNCFYGQDGPPSESEDEDEERFLRGQKVPEIDVFASLESENDN